MAGFGTTGPELQPQPQPQLQPQPQSQSQSHSPRPQPSSRRRPARSAVPAGLAALALVLGGCSGAKVGEAGAGSSGGGGGAGTCGSFALAVNPWVGYEANAAVIAYVAKKDLGCEVTEKDLKEEVAWQGFGTGEVDAIVENWGHPDLKKKYVEQQKTAVAAGETGNKGVIGWYVPPWLVQQYPDITQWENLNKYADRFKTSESGDKGQLLDGDPSFVTNDGALVKNLNLGFKVVYSGSEAALIQAFRQAEARKTPVIGYFYEPQWLFSELKLVKVQLPEYKAGCDDDPEKVACDYPVYALDKIVSKRFADSDSPAYRLVKNFSWSNEDQNLVAKYIAQDKMSPQDAAAKWVGANRAKVDAWLGRKG